MMLRKWLRNSNVTTCWDSRVVDLHKLPNFGEISMSIEFLEAPSSFHPKNRNLCLAFDAKPVNIQKLIFRTLDNTSGPYEIRVCKLWKFAFATTEYMR